MSTDQVLRGSDHLTASKLQKISRITKKEDFDTYLTQNYANIILKCYQQYQQDKYTMDPG